MKINPLIIFIIIMMCLFLVRKEAKEDFLNEIRESCYQYGYFEHDSLILKCENQLESDF